MNRGAGLFFALVGALAAIGGVVASSSPDGLERVAGDLGFAGRETNTLRAPLPDYDVPAAGPLGTPLAGLVGATGVGALAYGAGKLLRRGGSRA